MNAFPNVIASPNSTAADNARNCWSCGAQIGEGQSASFCAACGKVQPPAPCDYFAFFGLPRKLILDVKQLEKDFYELSRKLHPDLSARASAKEQEFSLEQSSLLNDAYRTLRDPIKRTEYLLHLEGVELEEQSKSATEKARATGETKKQIVPPDLLEEVFELNMQLEELRMQKKIGEDDPALIEEVGNQKLAFETKNEELLEELQEQWKAWDKLVDRDLVNHDLVNHGAEANPSERSQVIAKMVDVLNRRNYIRNLLRDVTAVMES